MKSITTLVAAVVACMMSVSAQLKTQSGMSNIQIIQLTDKVYYQLDSTLTFIENNNEWHNNDKTIYSYTEDNKIKESLTQTFHSNSWLNKSQTFYKYTDDSNSWSKEVQKWNNEEWNLSWKKSFIQDQNKGSLRITYSERNANNWIDIWQQDQYYDSDGKLLSYLTKKQDQSTTMLKDYWQYTCQYDNDGKLLLVNNQSFSQTTGELQNEYECLLEYDAEDLATEQIIDWDSETDDWKIISRNTVDNSQSNSTFKVSESWNEERNDWVKTTRLSETYDNNGNVFEIKREYWDRTQNNWIAYRIDNLVYNNDGVKTEEITFYPNTALNTWESHSRIVYHYKKVNDTEQEELTPNQDLIIYPNPADAEINLKFTGEAKKLDIYSVDGSLVLQIQVPTIYQSINVSSLQAGVYIAIVSLESGQAKMKFIKK